jgi:dolichyl-phosphate-mannose--protein O-mannosyl transferase
LERLRFKKLYQLPWVVFCLLILPLGLYILSYWPLFWQGKGLGYFLDLQVQIWRYQLAGAGNHAYQSQPWQWLLNLRPVWYWSNGTDRHIYAFNNPLLAWFEVGALGLLLTGVIRQTKPLIKYSLHFLLMLVGVLLIPWFFSPRIVFYYHFTPVTPLLAILLALVLDTLYLRRPTNLSKLIFFSLIIGLVWTFWLYYPNWVGLPVGQNTRETIYWLLPNWR